MWMHLWVLLRYMCQLMVVAVSEARLNTIEMPLWSGCHHNSSRVVVMNGLTGHTCHHIHVIEKNGQWINCDILSLCFWFGT